LTGPVSAGIHRVTWDLRYPPSTPVRLEPPRANPFRTPPQGPMVVPGRYTVELATEVDGKLVATGQSQALETRPLGTATLAAEDRQALLAFQARTARLQRAVLGAVRLVGETETRIQHLRQAILDTPGADPELATRLDAVEEQVRELSVELSGDPLLARYNEPSPPSVVDRVERIVSSQWSSTSAPTGTNREAYRIAGAEFAPLLEQLTTIVETDLPSIERRLEQAGAPWTPGRVPVWHPE